MLLLSLQSCPTLCYPIDGSPPGSPVPGILQARTLEGVAISCSSAWKWKVKGKSLSHVRLWATPWTAAHQAPPSMGFSRQEDWSGVPLPSPEDWWVVPKIVWMWLLIILIKAIHLHTRPVSGSRGDCPPARVLVGHAAAGLVYAFCLSSAVRRLASFLFGYVNSK